jgi:hypothetical protein
MSNATTLAVSSRAHCFISKIHISIVKRNTTNEEAAQVDRRLKE